MLQTGDVIGGRYRVERMLGMGGFGVVAAATHLELRSEVAIKMIRPEFIDDAETIERFLREARAVAQLRTEHVCRVFDIGRTDQDIPYIVMELLQGSDVAAVLRAQPLPVHTAVDYIRQACEALAEAHGRNIVHRDLKPPNLFVTRMPNNSSLLKVLDFGIAKAQDELRLTHTRITLGSPQYMSPEQLTTPKDVDARTDIWSIGVTLYHMLSRRLPFPSAQMAELGVMILTHPPAPIDVDPGLRAVLWRCLEKRRDARYQDIRELSAALAPYAQPAPVAHSLPPQMPAHASRPQMPGPQMPGPHASPQMPGPHALPPQSPPQMPGPHALPPQMPGPHASLPQMPSSSTQGTGHASMGMPMPAQPPAPRKSRALVFAALAVALVGGGAIAGYLALSKKAAKPTVSPAGSTVAVAASSDAAPSSPDAAVASAPSAPIAVVPSPDAPPDAAVARPAVDAAPRRPDPPPDRAATTSSAIELELAKLEGRISATLRTAPEFPSLMMTATQMACVLGDKYKARRYHADIGDANMRKLAADACRAHHIDL